MTPLARLTVLLVVSASSVGCEGVLHRRGNAFPCDFTQPVAVRDAVCAPGDVCGVDDRCRRYVYEGPSFEGASTLPRFDADAGAGRVLHPGPLGRGVRLLANDVDGLTLGLVLRDGALATVGLAGGVGVSEPLPAEIAGRSIKQVAILARQASWNRALVLLEDGLLVQLVERLPGAGGQLVPRIVLDGGVASLRLQPAIGGGLLATLGDEPVLVRPMPGSVAGQLTPARVGPAAPDFTPLLLPDGGQVLDLLRISRPDLRATLALGDNGFWLSHRDGGLTRIAEPLGAGQEASLSSDLSTGVFAVLDRRNLGAHSLSVLAVLRLVRGGADWSLEPVWSECAPCGLGRALHARPSLWSGRVVVELLCTPPQEPVQPVAVRVTGSSATSWEQACAFEVVDSPVGATDFGDPDASRLILGDVLSSGVVAASVGGRLWAGESYSSLRPLFLERVPRDVAWYPPQTADGGGAALSGLAALTDAYLAVDLGTESDNGFRSLHLERVVAGVRTTQVPLALVRGGGGWLVLPSGQLARFSRDRAAAGAPIESSALGPVLVDGQGAPVRTLLYGEAITAPDGGVLSAVLAADDGLYFAPLDAPGVAPQQLGPQLTPEPGMLIRSVALERSTARTNGIDRARGYLVTSRQLFVFQLAGSPPVWSATPIPLAGGEPLEVWMDTPLGSLGRIGYRDGRVFTLPGGFLLVDALEAVDGGAAPHALDYENLGGWPVVYASTGLFVAQWPLGDAGTPESRFPDGGVNRPMTWSPVTLPDGGTPWMRDARSPRGSVRQARPGRLYVKVEPPLFDAATQGSERSFELFLFLDDQVLQLGRHVRRGPPQQSE